MIFAGDPENGCGFDATLRQAFRQFYRRLRLVDRVQRSAKKTSLLTSNDCDAIRFAQPRDLRKGFLARAPAPIHLLQCVAKPRSIG